MVGEELAEDCRISEIQLRCNPGYAEQYNSYETLRFKDYSVMNANMFDGEYRKLRHETQFPIDEHKCYEMGMRLVKKAEEMNS